MASATAAVARVRLLGPVDVVSSDGNVHASGSALRRTLLSLLALRIGEVVSADWLLEHVWGHEPPDSGRRALRFHISQLRREMGDRDLIETRPAGYRLRPESAAVDVVELEELIVRARVQPTPADAVDDFARALALWRGDPFVDAAASAVLDDEAQRLSELRLSVLGELYVARLDAGATVEIIPDLSRLADENPLRESLWSCLITAQYRAGRQADALRSFEQLRVALAEVAGLTPSRDLQDLQARVLQQDHTLAGPAVHQLRDHGRGNLPAATTSLIDTKGGMDEVRRMLGDHRLVTLIGPGGVGKSRMAVEVGWSCIDDFSAGVWLVELAPVESPDGVVATLASTLSIGPQPSSSVVEALVDWFYARELLLILDNCEHVLGAARQLLTTIVTRCPSVKVLATSREPTGVPGERVHRVKVLDPDVDGVALFSDRATAADSSFAIGEGERAAVADLCRRLDGLPLAIELAAARVRSLSITDLLARLDDRFRLLRAAGKKGWDRHATLRATVEWSYRMLDDAGRAAFDLLSVFAGGFDLAAAEVICSLALDRLDERYIVDLLRDLVDKSLVIADRNPDGTRYRLLETLREFGADQLRAAGRADEARQRHLAYYVDVAERADDLYRTPRQVSASAIFNHEWDNLRRAHEWAIVTADTKAADRLLWAARLFANAQMRTEHRDWCERTLALAADGGPADVRTLTQAYVWAGVAEDLGRFNELRAQILDVIDLDDPSAVLMLTEVIRLEDPPIPDAVGRLESLLTNIDLDREWWMLIEAADAVPFDASSAEPLWITRLVDAAERSRVPELMVAASLHAGHAAMLLRSDYTSALELFRRGLEMSLDSRDAAKEADARRAIALALAALGDTATAERCHEALIKAYDLRYWLRIWQVFGSLGLTWAQHGLLEPASILLGYIELHEPRWGVEYKLGFRARTREMVQADPRSTEWLQRGESMSRHEIVEYAFSQFTTRQTDWP